MAKVIFVRKVFLDDLDEIDAGTLNANPIKKAPPS
jgi:hypothetical protein